MKKLVAILLAALMLLSLAGCDMDYAGKLTGTWQVRLEDDDEVRDLVMEFIELYEEEIAVVDSALYTSKSITFGEDGSYTIAEDPELVEEYTAEFYKNVFTDLYEGRAGLADLTEDYGVDLTQLSEEEFYAFYAGLYEYESIDELAEAAAKELVSNYDFSGVEEGTFTASALFIEFDATEDEMDGKTKYSISGDELTIHYSDGTEVYTKVD